MNESMKQVDLSQAMREPKPNEFEVTASLLYLQGELMLYE